MIFATAAEYNPFHNGHAYHISQIKKLGADGIIAVMSGSFVQRGEPAVMSKFERAKCAVRNGVDLVWNFPYHFGRLGGKVCGGLCPNCGSDGSRIKTLFR